MIEIRPIKQNEIEKAMEIMRASFPSSYHSIFYLYPDSTLVAVENDTILGGINLDIYEATVRVGYIGWLYVSEKARGRGIGETLVDEAVRFLENDKKTNEILLCIEGDNPSSFKNFSSRRGFEIMPLYKQIAIFRSKIFRVYRHASRFFDMGYFMWHKSCYSEKNFKSLNRSFLSQLIAFLCTVAFNTLFYLFMAIKFHRPTPLMIFTPMAVLSARTIAESTAMHIMHTRPMYLSWDTSWISSALSILLPFYFPSPGGIYPRGDSWSIKNKREVLGAAALAGVFTEAIMLIIFRGHYDYLAFALPLFILDTSFPMYPFCGFLASRLKRTYRKRYPIIVATALIISFISIFF